MNIRQIMIDVEKIKGTINGLENEKRTILDPKNPGWKVGKRLADLEFPDHWEFSNLQYWCARSYTRLRKTLFGKRFSDRIFEKSIAKEYLVLKEKEKKIQENLQGIDTLVNLTSEEYSKIEGDMRNNIENNVKRSRCGCSRHGARKFLYDLNDSESIIAYSAISGPLFSYCYVSNKSNSSSNSDTLVDLLDTSKYVVAKIKKETDVSEILLDNINSIALSTRGTVQSHCPKGKYDEIFSDVWQNFAKSAEEAYAQGRQHHACRIAGIMVNMSTNDEMKRTSMELKEKYSSKQEQSN